MRNKMAKVGKVVRSETDKKKGALPPMFPRPTKTRIWGVMVNRDVSGYCTSEANAKRRLADDLLSRDWYRNGFVFEVHSHFTMQRVVHEVA